MKDKERLAQVNARIKKSGITQVAIANRLGVHEVTVSKVLKGGVKGVRGDARKVAVALGLIEGDLDATVDDLLAVVPKAA